jgi:prepilin peptidase CpaA
VIEYAVFLVFPAAMAFAGAMDLFTMTIPNRISLVLVATFPLAALVGGIGWWAFAMHLAAGALMLVVGIFMFARGWLGGGDAKLLAAATLWLGFEALPSYLILVAIAGGALAALLLFFRTMAPPMWMLNQPWAMRLHNARTGIPYGIALAAAALHIYPALPWAASLTV